MTHAIDVADLNKSFGAKHVVKDFSLQVRRGEIYEIGRASCRERVCLVV